MKTASLTGSGIVPGVFLLFIYKRNKDQRTGSLVFGKQVIWFGTAMELSAEQDAV
ncbi:hypothetical protein [Bacillus atrophaeus]